MKSICNTFAAALVVLIVIGFCCERIVMAGSPEYQVKAAFLLNFAKFIEWPMGAFTDDKAPLVLGIVGTDPLENILDILNGQVVKNRTVKVQRLSGTDGIRQCHMLYIGASEGARLGETMRAVGNSSILTVSDGLERFAQHGVSINLVLVANKVRFEVNIAAAKKAGLSVGTQLLQVAKVVEGG
jgi:hypothetical protein